MKVSIVSNQTHSSIFVVRESEELISVLVWEQGRPAIQFNFHHYGIDVPAKAFDLRLATLNCNLESVSARMLRAGVPEAERRAVVETLTRRLTGWEQDWRICNFVLY